MLWEVVRWVRSASSWDFSDERVWAGREERSTFFEGQRCVSWSVCGGCREVTCFGLSGGCHCLTFFRGGVSVKRGVGLKIRDAKVL